MTLIVANTFHNIEKKCYSDFFASNFPETNRLTIAFSSYLQVEFGYFLFDFLDSKQISFVEIIHF